MPNPPARPWVQSQGSVIEIAPGHSDALICFSHLRWDFVFQRPQHIMTRFAESRRIIILEEPLKADPDRGPSLDLRADANSGVTVATPKLPEGLAGFGRDVILRQLLDELVSELGIGNPTLWYYTPMMLPFSRHLSAAAVVYDCMDELANFRFAPAELKALEAELISRADVVFTGGYSLYEAKREHHSNVHPFPSSVDRPHFAKARESAPDPAEHRRHAGPALRILRRHRRAARPRPDRQGRRRAARLEPDRRRTGGEDQPRRPAAPAEHLLARRQVLRPSCPVAWAPGTWR